MFHNMTDFDAIFIIIIEIDVSADALHQDSESMTMKAVGRNIDLQQKVGQSHSNREARSGSPKIQKTRGVYMQKHVLYIIYM